MPWTFYRYILWDLFKLLVMWTAMLSLLVAIAVSLKPLSDGFLQPDDLPRFIFYSAPTLIGFTAPFAGAFASTLVFCRLSQDNEILAASVSGMSYRTILLPVFMLGWGLSVVLFVMSNWVVPDFFKATERLVQKDVAKLLERKARRDQPLIVDDIVIYADQANIITEDIPIVYEDAAKTKPHKHQPYQWVSLDGVVVGKIGTLKDEEGEPVGRGIRNDIVARHADLALYSISGRTYASLRLTDAMSYDPDSDALGSGGVVDITQRIDVSLRDQTKFRNWFELMELDQHPEEYGPVDRAKNDLIAAMANARATQWLSRSLTRAAETGQGLRLRGANESEVYLIRPAAAPYIDDKNRIILKAAGAMDLLKVQLEVEQLERRDEGGEAWVSSETVESDHATIEVREPRPGAEPEISLRMWKPRTIDHRGPKDVVTPLSYDLNYPARFERSWLDAYQGHSVFTLLKANEQRVHDADDPLPQTVLAADQKLRDEVRVMRRRAVALLHLRTSLAIGSLLLLLLGAISSIKARGSLPLVVYIGSFLMAITVVIVVHAGENVVLDPRNPHAKAMGLSIIWSGNLLLLAVMAVLYRRLRRN